MPRLRDHGSYLCLATAALAAAAWDPIFNPADHDPFFNLTRYLNHVTGHLFHW